MSVKEVEFSKNDLKQGLSACGLRAGDVVFVEILGSAIGAVEGGSSRAETCEAVLECLMGVIGSDGTLLTSAFSHSFDQYEPFDVEQSAAVADQIGQSEFSKLVRGRSGAIRSGDPLYSIVGIGPMAEKLLTCLPNSSFGEDGTFGRLINMGAKVCLIGAELRDSILLNFAEASSEVPWRYKKLFTGHVVSGGKRQRQGWIASVRNEKVADQAGEIRSRVALESRTCFNYLPFGNTEVGVADMADLCDLVSSKLVSEAGRFRARAAGAGTNVADVELPPAASMGEMISALWRLPRDIVSDGYDTAMRALATQVPLKIHEYPTGTECWSWLVPEKWTCRDARLETLDGRVLFSYRENPLHCVSYSLPLDGVVKREELFKHLHTHARLDDAVPFIFKYYERDWGLCCSKNLKDQLTDDEYRVVIDSEFSFGSLKVGECIARGRSEKTFVFCAHLCHPAMVNDDLSGVVVGIKVMQELLKRTGLKYTYRFVILPETIGSVAYLSHNEDLIPKMAGGLFLEMLGLDNPHALQLSFDGNTEMDRCLTRILSQSDPAAWTGAFRTVVGNDERQFNGPGVRVPMLSLSRVRRERSNGWPYYPEYHSSYDTPELASEDRLRESCELVLRMVDAIETNEVPVNLFNGELFCSRYGLHIDAYSNPEGNRAFFDILFLVDGSRSVAEIARICGISIESVRSVIEELVRRGLVAYAPV